MNSEEQKEATKNEFQKDQTITVQKAEISVLKRRLASAKAELNTFAKRNLDFSELKTVAGDEALAMGPEDFGGEDLPPAPAAKANSHEDALRPLEKEDYVAGPDKVGEKDPASEQDAKSHDVSPATWQPAYDNRRAINVDVDDSSSPKVVAHQGSDVRPDLSFWRIALFITAETKDEARVLVSEDTFWPDDVKMKTEYETFATEDNEGTKVYRRVTLSFVEEV